jgi:hypothetical protein
MNVQMITFTTWCKPLLPHKYAGGGTFSVSELTNSKIKSSEIRDGKAENLQGTAGLKPVNILWVSELCSSV